MTQKATKKTTSKTLTLSRRSATPGATRTSRTTKRGAPARRTRPGRPTRIEPKSRGAKLLLAHLGRFDLTQVDFARMIDMNHIRLNHILSGRTSWGRRPEPTLREAFMIEKKTNGDVPADSWLRALPAKAEKEEEMEEQAERQAS